MGKVMVVSVINDDSSAWGRLTRHEAMRRHGAYRQYRELRVLCEEIGDLLRLCGQREHERIESLWADWFEAATSARELACAIWPDAPWMHERFEMPN